MAEINVDVMKLGAMPASMITRDAVAKFAASNNRNEVDVKAMPIITFNHISKVWNKSRFSISPELVYAEYTNDDGSVTFSYIENGRQNIAIADSGQGVKPVKIGNNSEEACLVAIVAMTAKFGKIVEQMDDVSAVYAAGVITTHCMPTAKIVVNSGNIKLDDKFWEKVRAGAEGEIKNPHAKVSAEEIAKKDPSLNTPGYFDMKSLGEDTSSLDLAKIPQAMGKGFVPNRQIWEKAQTAFQSMQLFDEPIVNFGLRGPAGSGKSVGVKYFAFLTGLPYYRFLCTVNMDESAMYGGYQPRTERSFSIAGLPSFQDVEMDYKSAWKQMTGKEADRNVDRAVCLQELTRRMSEDDTNFIFVYSEFIKAVMYGGVLEVGEAEIVKQQGALTALNNIMEKGAGAFFTLPNGKKVTRHPLFIPIFTTNDGYAGCKPLNESVLSRLDEMIDVPTPQIDELVARTKGQCKSQDGTILFADEDSLRKMATTIEEIRVHAAEDPSLGGGSVGARELFAWAKKALLLQMRQDKDFTARNRVSADNQIRAAFTTVLSKSSQDEEGREVLGQIFEQVYGVAEVNRIRQELA